MRKALASVLLSCASGQVPTWYLVQVPDTQHYSYDTGRMVHFYLQALSVHGWGALPAVALHMGDITENARDVEFERALSAMRLFAPVPWAACIGNHDYQGGRKPVADGFRRWFGEENTATVFPTPDGDVAALMLEYMPSDDAIAFARAFMDAHPTMPTVLSTHYWLEISGERGRVGSRLDGAGDNSPAEVWAKLCLLYPQTFLVLCGHVSGEALRSDGTLLGTTVVQVLSDYQSDPDGGQGFLRLIAFGGRQAWLLTHSSSYLGLPPNRFGVLTVPCEDVAALRARLRPVDRLEPSEDTFVAPCWGGIGPRGSWDTLLAAGSGCQEHALLHFPVPRGAVSRALLTLTIEGPSADGAGFSVHRMLRPWAEDTTWTALGGLVPGRDYDAAPAAVTLSPLPVGTHSVDVTDALRTGAPYGFVLVGLGESSALRSREWHASAERPMLSVWH
jgi:hypothetical protein